MLFTYERNWPSNDFIFRIPYQEYPTGLVKKFGTKIELVKSNKSIKETGLNLLSGLNDNQWIYWCADDKYLIELEENLANGAHSLVKKIDDRYIINLSFCRCRLSLQRRFLIKKQNIKDGLGQEYFERKRMTEPWMHQYYRVKWWRKFFESLPDTEFPAKKLDTYYRKIEWIDGSEYRAFVAKVNIVVFGESTTRGKITKNCIESFKKYKLSLPQGFAKCKACLVIGEIENDWSSGKKILTYLFRATKDYYLFCRKIYRGIKWRLGNFIRHDI
jgi:hypothetical protein